MCDRESGIAACGSCTKWTVAYTDTKSFRLLSLFEFLFFMHVSRQLLLLVSSGAICFPYGCVFVFSPCLRHRFQTKNRRESRWHAYGKWRKGNKKRSLSLHYMLNGYACCVLKRFAALRLCTEFWFSFLVLSYGYRAHVRSMYVHKKNILCCCAINSFWCLLRVSLSHLLAILVVPNWFVYDISLDMVLHTHMFCCGD